MTKQRAGKGKKLWVDDVRTPPSEEWDWALNFHFAIMYLETFDYEEVSLDHDLASFYGTREMTGRDILNWLIARIYSEGHTPKVVKVHSANAGAVHTMEADIARYFPRGQKVEAREAEPLPLDIITDAHQEPIHIQKDRLVRRMTPVRNRK